MPSTAKDAGKQSFLSHVNQHMVAIKTTDQNKKNVSAVLYLQPAIDWPFAKPRLQMATHHWRQVTLDQRGVCFQSPTQQKKTARSDDNAHLLQGESLTHGCGTGDLQWILRGWSVLVTPPPHIGGKKYITDMLRKSWRYCQLKWTKATKLEQNQPQGIKIVKRWMKYSNFMTYLLPI